MVHGIVANACSRSSSFNATPIPATVESMTVFRVPSRFSPSLIDVLVASWDAVAAEVELVVELPAESFFEPGLVAFLAASVSDRARKGLRTTIAADDWEVDGVRYLQRIDFFQRLGVEIPERFRRRDADDRFVALNQIVDLRVARELADASVASLAANLPAAAPSVLRFARFVFEELGVNVVQHSGQPETGFGLAQAYPNRRPPRYQFAFADRGVGFLSSLQRNPELAGSISDDAEALQLAVEEGMSGAALDARKNMGIGLGQLRALSDRTNANVWILSGSALWHRRTLPNGSRVATTRAVTSFQGAWICFDGPADPAQI